MGENSHNDTKLINIYNGENQDITVITDHGSTTIPAQSSAMLKVDKDAIFGQPEFYVEEQGKWYIKKRYCHSGCDAEIYNAD